MELNEALADAPAPQTENAPRPARLTRAERRVRSTAAEIRRAQLLEEARRQREQRAAEWADERAQLRAERRRRQRTERAAARAERFHRVQAFARRLGQRLVLAGTNVGVNGVAVVGQVLALYSAGWPLPAAVLGAVVIESVAVYVGWHAHVALLEGDSAVRLRATSYLIALGVGYLNYSHNDPRWAPMFAGCSIASPWLWAMYSRHVHRQQLRAAGLIDKRAPKFAVGRWAMWSGETFHALRFGVRHGIQDPAAALEQARPAYEQLRRRKAAKGGRRRAAVAEVPAEHAAAGDKAVKDLRGFDPRAAVRRSLRRAAAVVGPPAPGAASLPTPRPVAEPVAAATSVATAQMTMDEADELPPSQYGAALARTPWVVGRLVPLQLPPRPVLRPAGQGPVRLVAGPGGLPMAVAQPVAEQDDPRPGDDPGRDRKRPTDQDRRRWVRTWINRAAKGEVWSKRELADRSSFSETWALDRIREAREQMAAEGWTFDEDGRPVRPVAELVANSATGGAL